MPEPLPLRTSTEQDGNRAGATTADVTETAPNDGTTYNVAVSGMTNSGTVIDLHGTSMTIGRSNDAAIHLDDDYASNRHARLASAGDHWFVEDLGSTNGTYIGAHRISQPTAVSVGTRIRIGKSILEIKK